MKGDIVYATFPYIDGNGSKRRPAVVLAEAPGRLICAAVTSRGSRNNKTVVDIDNWVDAGLTKPSSVKMDTITTFSPAKVKKVGKLGKKDVKRIMRTFRGLVL